jgi:hypothetical protein
MQEKMKKINIITPPDKIYNDNYKILLLFPTKNTLNEIQSRVLTKVDSLNIYLYDKPVYNKEDTNWMLDVFFTADFVLIDIDSVPPYFRDLLSFLVAKSKTYWLTNAVDCMYNHISNNRLQDLNILSIIGDHIEVS